MDVEQVLAGALADRGIEVERGTELAGVRDGPEGVRAILRSPARSEETLFGFVAGCDGPASTVRDQAGIGWPGRPYPVEIVLADAELDGDLADDAARVVAGRRGLLFVFRLGERATWRLLATRPAGADQLPPGQFGPPVPAAELQALMDEAGLGAQITDLAWSSRVRVQHRVAEPVPPGPAVPGRGRRPCLLPGHRPGDERRHPGCGQPRLEARVRSGPAGPRAAARLLRPRAPAGGASGTGHDAPGVLGRSLRRSESRPRSAAAWRRSPPPSCPR